jgi:hypothetical protein
VRVWWSVAWRGVCGERQHASKAVAEKRPHSGLLQAAATQHSATRQCTWICPLALSSTAKRFRAMNTADEPSPRRASCCRGVGWLREVVFGRWVRWLGALGWVGGAPPPSLPPRTRAVAHGPCTPNATHTHTRTHARTHARTHTHTHNHDSLVHCRPPHPWVWCRARSCRHQRRSSAAPRSLPGCSSGSGGPGSCQRWAACCVG